jgi:hypothetical protein
MAYIDAVVGALRAAPGPLTTHEIAEAVRSSGAAPSSPQPSEATLTTWLYAMTGHSHDHPDIHRVDRASSGRASVCWICDTVADQRSPTH